MPKIDTTVANLVEMIKNGELRLPEMQRRYVWPATRVRDLLEICVVRVAPSPRPVYLEDGQQVRFYLRSGNTTQELGIRDSVDYIKTRWP